MKEAIRNITDAIYYGFATWLYNTAGFVSNNKFKFIGVGFLILASICLFLPSSEVKYIAILAYTFLGFGLIFRKDN